MKTNQKQKLKLKELQINSFATNLNNASQQTIEGASISAAAKWILKQTAALVSWEAGTLVVAHAIESIQACGPIEPHSFGYNQCIPSLHSCSPENCPVTYLECFTGQ